MIHFWHSWHLKERRVRMLQVKFDLRLKLFNLGWFSFSLFPSPNYSWIRARRQRKLRINLGLKKITWNQIWPVTHTCILSGWRSTSVNETVKNSLKWPGFLHLMFRESSTNKVSKSDYTFNFAPVVPTCLFLCECHINFLHFERISSILC